MLPDGRDVISVYVWSPVDENLSVSWLFGGVYVKYDCKLVVGVPTNIVSKEI